MSHEDFTQRIEAIKHQLYKTAHMYLKNQSSAVEAVDETVYKALKNLKQLRQTKYFNTWVTRILINECKRELKRQKRWTLHESMEETVMPDNALDALPLKDAVHALPEKLRSVVILRYFSGYTQLQTAEVLNIPQGTVVTRQRKALKVLKLELSEVASYE